MGVVENKSRFYKFLYYIIDSDKSMNECVGCTFFLNT